MAVRHLVLTHRWGHHPLWDDDSGTDVDPSTLQLPGSVVDRLAAWADRWDLTFDIATGRTKVDEFVLAELGRDGARLWRALLGLLPPQTWAITYVHHDVVYRTVDELPPEWRVG